LNFIEHDTEMIKQSLI